MRRRTDHAGNVIGVDDFAFRRGKRYGTIVIDHESGCTIFEMNGESYRFRESVKSARPAEEKKQQKS